MKTKNKNGRAKKEAIVTLPINLNKTKVKVGKLELLVTFGMRSASERNLDSLLELLAEEAKIILSADRCSIFIVNRKKKTLWSKVAQGTKEIIAMPWDKGLVGDVVQTGKILNIKEAYNDARFNFGVDQKTGYRTHSILTCPMKNLRGQAVGAFQVLNKKPNGSFSSEDEGLLTILSSQAAVAIENAQLYQEVQEATHDTIFRLAAAAEYKDHDTAAHLIRMSRYSRLIAETLGYPEEFCQSIEMASPMHDIGKIGVPDSILTKPGKLTDEEWVEMKKHPVFGAEILKNSENPLLQMSQIVALTHHEKYDGTGYPKGLKGEEIPIEGRITALADVFDALTSKRCYREKFPIEESLKIIREGIGKHFDPRVIQAFEKALPKIIEVFNTFQEKSEPAA